MRADFPKRHRRFLRGLMVGAPPLIGIGSAIAPFLLKVIDIDIRYAYLFEPQSQLLIAICFMLAGIVMWYSYRELERIVAYAERRRVQRKGPSGAAEFDNFPHLLSIATQLAKSSSRILILNTADLDNYHTEIRKFFRELATKVAGSDSPVADFRLIMNANSAGKIDLLQGLCKTFKKRQKVSCACVDCDPRAFSHLSFCVMENNGDSHIFLFSDQTRGNQRTAILMSDENVGTFLSNHFDRIWQAATAAQEPLVNQGSVDADQLSSLIAIHSKNPGK